MVIDDNPQLQLVNNTYQLDLKVQNSGKTPAYEIVTQSSIEIQPINGPFEVVDVAVKGKRMTTGPGRIWTLPMRKPLEDIDRARIRNRTHAVRLFGSIEYLDAFGEKHVTNFNYRQHPPGNMLLIEDTGNDST